MCGLPTETDEDVLQIADLAQERHRAGREATGTRDIRCTVSIGGFVPKPHTPFQWAAQLGHEATDARLGKLRDAIRATATTPRPSASATTTASPAPSRDCSRRGDRRIGAVIREVWEDGARFDGWSEHFSYDRWVAAADRALAGTGVDVDWYTTREREQSEVLPVGPPRLGPGQGMALAGLAGRPLRGRGRRLPLDPVLRLRRLPADGHRHPGRPDRGDAAAADRGPVARARAGAP